MPFIPHTQQDVESMLNTIGVKSMEDLFDEIPAALKADHLQEIPDGLTEMELSRLMQARAEQDSGLQCFIGAGAYEHHIPAAVWDVAGRGEFYTAYTPYQAEASQGTLQLLYEYQTMMTRLTALDVSNASMYDGASALAESVLMTARLQKTTQARVVLLPKTLHPAYRRVVKATVQHQNIQFIDVDFDIKTGMTSIEQLNALNIDALMTLVIPQPNFFGVLEDVHALTDWAHQKGAYVIGVVNPTALAILEAPGAWGEHGVDIACGEGQPLGIPLASGGPYFGFLCAKQAFVRQMPGRIIGRTVDREGKDGFTLTLQAREQHIRRAKATSNICTNQGLMVTAATIYLSLLGAQGLQQVATKSHQATTSLLHALTTLPGVSALFDSPYFHEVAIRLPKPVNTVLIELEKRGILGGYALTHDYPACDNALLICATETKTDADIHAYQMALQEILLG